MNDERVNAVQVIMISINVSKRNGLKLWTSQGDLGFRIKVNDTETEITTPNNTPLNIPQHIRVGEMSFLNPALNKQLDQISDEISEINAQTCLGLTTPPGDQPYSKPYLSCVHPPPGVHTSHLDQSHTIYIDSKEYHPTAPSSSACTDPTTLGVGEYRFLLEAPIDAVHRVEMLYLNLPNGSYTVDLHNKDLAISLNLTRRDLEMQVGMYDVTSFIDMVTELFNEHQISITLSFDAILSKLTFTTQGDNITFHFDITPGPSDLFGFPPQPTVISEGTTNQVAPYRIDLLGNRNLNVHVGNGHDEIPSKATVLYRAPCSPETIAVTYSAQDGGLHPLAQPPSLNFTSTKTFDHIHIYLSQYRYGQFLPFNLNGIHFGMVLRIYPTPT